MVAFGNDPPEEANPEALSRKPGHHKRDDAV
jgi:hypothetical protein